MKVSKEGKGKEKGRKREGKERKGKGGQTDNLLGFERRDLSWWWRRDGFFRLRGFGLG